MCSRNIFASILAGCLLTVGLIGVSSTASAAPAARSFFTLEQGVKNSVTPIKRRRYRAKRLYVPIAPSYLAYDYPYYYSRGYYPTHIGPGYIYYGRPYFHYRHVYYPRYNRRHYGYRKHYY